MLVTGSVIIGRRDEGSEPAGAEKAGEERAAASQEPRVDATAIGANGDFLADSGPRRDVQKRAPRADK